MRPILRLCSHCSAGGPDNWGGYFASEVPLHRRVTTCKPCSSLASHDVGRSYRCEHPLPLVARERFSQRQHRRPVRPLLHANGNCLGVVLGVFLGVVFGPSYAASRE